MSTEGPSFEQSLTQILEQYGEPRALKWSLSTSYTNKNYKVETETGVSIMKVYRGTSYEQVAYEQSLMQRVQKEGVPVVLYRKNLQNMLLTNSDLGVVAMFDFIEGQEPTPSVKVNSAIGGALGKIHAIEDWRQFKKKHFGGREFIQEVGARVLGRQDIDDSLKERFFAYSQSDFVPPNISFPQGIVHGDLFTDNTIFQASRLAAILDFEFAGTGDLAFDVGMTINGFCFVDNFLDRQSVASFLDSYQQTRKLTREEKEYLLGCVRMGALSMVGYHLDGLMRLHNERQVRRASYLLDRLDNLADVNYLI